MRLKVDKPLLPIAANVIARAKTLADNRQANYSYTGNEYDLPSQDFSLEEMQDVARSQVTVNAYELWYEIPDANLTDEIPEGVSWRTYEDFTDPENPVTVTRKWEDLPASRTGTGVSMRYYQPANNGEYNPADAQILLDDGIAVFGPREMLVRISEPDYFVGDPEFDVPVETIEWIDQNWSEGKYYDIVHAYLNMREVYLAKGATENDAWAACTDEEKDILVKWNQVGLGKAATTLDPAWTEAQKARELGRIYEFFIDNMSAACRRRFGRWWTWLLMSFTNAGGLKFEADWDSALKQRYIDGLYRQFELGKINALVDFTDVFIRSYLDTDFVWTFTPNTIADNLIETLNGKIPPV